MQTITQILISWGAPGLLVLAVLDSAGVPLPAAVDALVVAMAVVSPATAWLSAGIAAAGSAAGCMILFYISRKGGQLYLERHTRTGRARKLRLWFQRYGLIAVFIPAVLPLPLPMKVFVISAGALGTGPLPFLLTVLAARIPRYLGLAYLGMQLGEHSAAWLRQHVWHVAGVALGLLVALFLLVKFRERFRKQPAALG